MTCQALRGFAYFSSAAIAALPLCSQSKSAAAQSSPTPPNSPVQIVMKNVMNHFNDQVAVHIVQLQGSLTPVKSGGSIVLDDLNSFTVNLTSAEIAIACDSLANLLNQNVFSSSSAPIKDIMIASKNNQLNITGKLRRKGDLPFEAVGTLSLDPDGRIRLHADHLKAAHFPLKGLMDLLGLDVAEMINTKKIPSISAEKDDLLIDPEAVLPPPHIHGKLASIRIQGDEVVEVFGAPASSSFTAKQSGNFIAYRGGALHLANYSVENTDVILIDLDPSDPLDFSIAHYKEQLAAGYIKTTPEFGLRIYARDYNKLHAAGRNGAEKN
jgi:hypothetical protein